jgi:dihydroorotate dehydrogenase
VPSHDPPQWQAEIDEILNELPDGKLLIVSVMGLYEDLEGDALIEDFVDVARLAEEAGAPAIELNLSCPNTVSAGSGMRPPICADPVVTEEIVRRVYEGLQRDTPLVAKLSYLSGDALYEVVERIAPAVRGISGINTLQVRVLDHEGQPIFKRLAGDDERNREFAGISGIAIRDLARDFVVSLYRLKRAEGWDFDIIGMGGIMETHDVRTMMALGADAVQTATGAATNPHLPDHLISPILETGESERVGLARIRSALLGTARSLDEVAAELDLDREAVHAELSGEEDLPAQVSKLLWLRDQALEPVAPDINPELWGPEPSIEQTAELTSLAQRHRVEQWRRLAETSLSRGEVAALVDASEHDVAQLALQGKILGSRWLNELRFPRWQFSNIEAALEVATAFPGDLAALNDWMLTPHVEFGDDAPAQLAERGDWSRVLSTVQAISAAGR